MSRRRKGSQWLEEQGVEVGKEGLDEGGAAEVGGLRSLMAWKFPDFSSKRAGRGFLRSG